MKLSVLALLALPALTAAFAPAQSRVAFMTSLNVAKSKEEDLELTRQVIDNFMDGDSSEPAPAPAPAPAAAPTKEEE